MNCLGGKKVQPGSSIISIVLMSRVAVDAMSVSLSKDPLLENRRGMELFKIPSTSSLPKLRLCANAFLEKCCVKSLMKSLKVIAGTKGSQARGACRNPQVVDASVVESWYFESRWWNVWRLGHCR